MIKDKGFIALRPGADVIKHLCPKFTNIRNKLTGNPIQTCPMFVSKALAYPSEVPFMYSTLGRAHGISHKY